MTHPLPPFPVAADRASAAHVGDVTVLLHRLHGGDAAALDRLLPLVYDELRAAARRALAREDAPSAEHTRHRPACGPRCGARRCRSPGHPASRCGERCLEVSELPLGRVGWRGAPGAPGDAGAHGPPARRRETARELVPG